jgi:hypothetical protein
MISLIGQVVAHHGLVNGVDPVGAPEPYTLPANAYLRDQPAGLGLFFDHDTSWRIGDVEFLQRSRADGLMMVGRVVRDDLADLLLDGDWYLSDGVNCRATGPLMKGHAQLREISLVRRSANVGSRPLRWARSDLGADAGSEPGNMPLNWYGCWTRAHEAIAARRYRRTPDRLAIVDLDPLGYVDEILTAPAATLAAARRRAEAAKPRPPVEPPGPLVRLHGVLLDARRSAEILDRLEFGPAPA